ncbi:MAG TPA: LON peptidase substrate-binding domain-containing protein [Planctomycetota bacterium]|nr:LON peptidase substrate-binding domain-containing protein [Planctomycetota bacterium]
MSADHVPDAWPPELDADAHTVVPLFPLSGVFLFPGTLLPLHIFEPRYRQMIEDCLDGPGRIVIGTPLEGERGTRPAVHAIAGLGEIARHERLDDGRFVILLAGLTRVRIQEVKSPRLYRRVAVEALAETPVDESREAELRQRLVRAVQQRVSERLDLPEHIPLGNLTDYLLLRLQIPQATMQDLYSQLAVADRAEGALAEHARCPLPPGGTAPPGGTPPSN